MGQHAVGPRAPPLSSRPLQVLKVAILAEKYAVDYTWYVDTILNLIRIAGDYVSEEVWYRVIQIVINRDDVQGYAAKTVFEVWPVCLSLGKAWGSGGCCRAPCVPCQLFWEVPARAVDASFAGARLWCARASVVWFSGSVDEGRGPPGGWGCAPAPPAPGQGPSRAQAPFQGRMGRVSASGTPLLRT